MNFVQDVYIRTHTKNTYTVHTIRKFMTQGRKWQVPNFNPMLLLDKTSIWSLSTCEIEEFSLALLDAFCSRCFYPHTHKKHIHCTYHLKVYDPRKKMTGAKCSSDTSAWKYEYLKLKYLRNRGVFSRATRRILFKMFISAHTHTKHIHYTYHLKAYDARKKMTDAKC